MLQTIPNNVLDFEFNRFVLWVIASVDNVGLSFGIQSSLKSKVHVVFVPFVSFKQRLQQMESHVSGRKTCFVRIFSGLRDKSQTWLKSHGSIFTSTIHTLLTLHTAETSAVLELDFQLHKLRATASPTTIVRGPYLKKTSKKNVVPTFGHRNIIGHVDSRYLTDQDSGCCHSDNFLKGIQRAPFPC